MNTNKIKDRSGFTLVELLTALIIFSFVAMIMVGGISFATRQYAEQMRLSESKVLYSDLSAVITNELRYTTQVKKVNDKYKIYSVNYSDEDDLVYFDSSDEGQLVLRTTGTQHNLINSKCYTNNLQAEIKNISYNNTTYRFTVELVIKHNSTVYQDHNIEVNNLNKITVE